MRNLYEIFINGSYIGDVWAYSDFDAANHYGLSLQAESVTVKQLTFN